MWQLVCGPGLSLLWGGIGNLDLSDQVAELIAGATGSPFQREAGKGDALIGIVGILCQKFRYHFWLLAIIGCGLFLFGAGLGHVYEFIAHWNVSPNTICGVLCVALLFPILLAALCFLCHREKADDHTLR